MTLAESTILVVDDEPVLQLTFSIVLKQTGATVFTAGNGAEALELLKHQRVDLILSDKQMPEMDGLTMLQALFARGIRIPTVFFVNGVTSENPAEMDRLSVVQTVTKPLHPRELTQIIARALEALPAR